MNRILNVCDYAETLGFTFSHMLGLAFAAAYNLDDDRDVQIILHDYVGDLANLEPEDVPDIKFGMETFKGMNARPEYVCPEKNVCRVLFDYMKQHCEATDKHMFKALCD